MNAKNCMTKTEKKQIEDLIAGIESKTSAEIVCAVATESGRYDRAESIAGIVFALIFLFVGQLVLNKILFPGSTWGNPYHLNIFWQGGLVVGGFIIGNVMASCCHALRRLFCFDSEMTLEVERAAQSVFCARRIYSTKTSGGCLIYISLFERRLRIITDDNVRNKLPDDQVQQIRDSIIPMLKQKKVYAALEKAVTEIGTRLEQNFSIQPGDQNELANKLIIIHPRP